MDNKVPQTLIVIPCYNECDRLPEQEISDFLKNSEDVQLLLVNDGSVDTTGMLLDKLASENEKLSVLHLPHNCGKAEAVRRGILKSLEDKPTCVGYWDADMATPLGEIENFIKMMEDNNYDAVIGCRLARLGSKVYRKKSRHYLGRIFATVVSSMLNISVYDTQCGAKLFRSDLAEKIFKEPFITRWLFDVELIKRILKIYGPDKTREKIYEYPLMQWADVGGSKLKFSSMLKVPFLLLKIFLSK